jgi:hypothetical protein
MERALVIDCELLEVIVNKRDCNRSANNANNPIQNPSLLVTEDRTREILVSEVVTTINTWQYEATSKHQGLEWKRTIGQGEDIQNCAFSQQRDVNIVWGHK